MALYDKTREKLNSPTATQTAPLRGMPRSHLQRRVITLLAGTLSLDRQRDGMLAEVAEVGVIDRLSRSRVADGLDGLFLGATTLRTYKQAEVDHLGRRVSGLVGRENLSGGTISKVDHALTSKAVGAEDLFENRCMNICVP